MKHFYLSLILFFLVVAEGVALEFLPLSLGNTDWLIIPHWVLIYLVLMAVFFDHENSYFSVLYGILFGMMVDIVYTDVLGVYTFFYALTAYAVHGLKKMLHNNIFVAAALSLFAVVMADSSVHILYSLTSDKMLNIVQFLNKRLLPTLTANLLFFLVIYPISKNALARWGTNSRKRTNTL